MVFHCNQSAPQQLYLNHRAPNLQHPNPFHNLNHQPGPSITTNTQLTTTELTSALTLNHPWLRSQNPFTSPSSTHLCLTNPTKQLCHPVPSPLHHPSFSITKLQTHNHLQHLTATCTATMSFKALNQAKMPHLCSLCTQAITDAASQSLTVLDSHLPSPVSPAPPSSFSARVRRAQLGFQLRRSQSPCSPRRTTAVRAQPMDPGTHSAHPWLMAPIGATDANSTRIRLNLSLSPPFSSRGSIAYSLCFTQHRLQHPNISSPCPSSNCNQARQPHFPPYWNQIQIRSPLPTRLLDCEIILRSLCYIRSIIHPKTSPLLHQILRSKIYPSNPNLPLTPNFWNPFLTFL
ncbi:hypothetical protein M0R45_029544 [Rubus argutus]|uniref:Uncharacterized protein n=1 Tax=Rubus argutus TaxID=59490 RepID=A0AAW1W9B1_RUBAR